MISRWNREFTWPKLKTASATQFFTEMEQKHGDSFEVIRGAWPDWWTDGFGASAREVAATRMAQSDLIANTAGLTMAAMQGARMPGKSMTGSMRPTRHCSSIPSTRWATTTASGAVS
jgi:alpha-mannosidase